MPQNTDQLLQRLHDTADRHDQVVMPRVMAEAVERGAGSDADVADLLADAHMPIDPENGRLLHVLASARRPGRIVEFGTSHGLSTIYLAGALEPDEPPMIATEYESEKVAAASTNLASAGLLDRVDLRAGDAFETLAELHEPISLLFLDGWKVAYLPMLRLLEQLLVDGALVVADDTNLLPDLCTDYLEHVRDPDNGYRSADLPVKDGLEISVRR